MKQISILGCGWLGMPLAENLIANNFIIKGSTTTELKLDKLKNLGIQPFLIVVNDNEIIGNIIKFLENSTILIIDIPPKLRGLEKENFVNKIKTLLPFIKKSTIKNVIFISSTSVYSDNTTIVTDAILPQPDTESGKQLLEVEQLLQNDNDFNTTIVRFGGLIGDSRHPIRFLSGRKNIENPNAPINLIHQKDCIGILLKIIKMEFTNETFNAVTPYHPSRKEYYCQKALQMGLALPEFNESNPSIGKTIVSDKLERILEYHFLEKYL